MAQSLCAASCCTSCPPDPSAFATMGFWPRRARGSSCQQHAWLCRCLQPARRPLSRPRRSWRGWPGWMWACARVAWWAGCAPSLCWRGWRGWGACLDRPAPWRLTAGGRHEPLPWPGSVNPSHGRWQAFGAVLRVGAPTRAQHGLIHGPGVVWRVQLTTCAVTLARSHLRGQLTQQTSPLIICFGIRGAKLANPYAAHAHRSRWRFSPTRFICRRRCSWFLQTWPRGR